VLKYAALEMLDAWRQPTAGGISRVAHRVAFHYDPRPGYLYVRSRMISSRTNDNHDTFPAGEIEKGYKTFLGKPVFVNHNNANHRRARGVIVAVALHRDRTREGQPDTWVEGLMEVDAVRFPRLAKAILEGRVNRTSMGVDVDWSTCSACGNKATSPAEYCKHLPAMKGRKIRQRNKKTGKVEERLIHEICAGLSFFENSLLVEDPADPTAFLIGKPDTRGMEKAAALRRAQARRPYGELEPHEQQAASRAASRRTAMSLDVLRHLQEKHGMTEEEAGRRAHAAYFAARRRPLQPEAPGYAAALSEGLKMAHHIEHGGDYQTPAGSSLHAHGYEDDLTSYKMKPRRLNPGPEDSSPVLLPGEGRVGWDENVRGRTRAFSPAMPHMSAREPDFRDHLGNTCRDCGQPVRYVKGRGNWKHDSARPEDHQAVPADPRDRSGAMLPGTFGGTTCATCGEDVKINLRALGTSSGGWHHHDGMKRDHLAVPLDPQAVYDSIPGARAAVDQARARVSDQMHSQFEQMSGRPLPRRPRGDEDQMPRDPFTARRQRRTAYGETRVPPQVDTLRMDECPVCGEHNVWSGSRCPVCGFVVPPSVFRDPDTDKARQVRDQLDSSGEVTEDPETPQGQEMGEEEQIGSGDDADDQLTHPDQIAPDGVPIVQGEGGPVPGEEDNAQEGPPPEEEGEEQGEPGGIPDDTGEEGGLPEDDGEEPGDELECPACGTTFETDAYAQPGMPCPACGMASLHPIDEGEEGGGGFPPDDEDAEGDEEGEGPQKDQEDDPSAPGDEKEEDEDMPAKTGAALMQAQARKIAEQSAMIEALSAQLRYLASAAGVGRELDEVGRRVMRRHADILNPASPVPDPPEGPPSETTEQALMPEAMDDPSRPGATPGANSRVPAAQTTTAITPGVEMQTPPATNLVDVTAPVQGTNPSQDGGVPIDQRRIETDVRVDPNPLKAQGPGIGGQGDNGSAFPWVLDARMPGQAQGGQPGQGQRAASLGRDSSAAVAAYGAAQEAESSRRTFAAIRLAKLRVQAGLAQGDELAVAERIERDASLSTAMIEHDISTLEQVGAMARPQAPLQRQAARSAPSLASVGAASQYAPATADDLDGSDLFL
jgi:hypothetical protein